MMSNIIDDIATTIKWLDDRLKSEDIVAISMVIDKLAIQSMTVSNDVTQAYELMSRAEDAYKYAVANYMSTSTGPISKAEMQATVMFKELKDEWTTAKCIYKKLDTYLDRLDKIIEVHRQRVSVIKQASLKNLSSGI